MPERPTSTQSHDGPRRATDADADAGAALAHQRPLSGDRTSATRKLLEAARRREGRFLRRAPVEPMS